MGDTPEYLNDYQPGAKPLQGQSRADRLKAAGVSEGETLLEYQQRLRNDAWANSGSQEDSGAEFQRVSSKQGRENVEMPKSGEGRGQQQGASADKPRVEPVTEQTVEGHSPEKKAALKLSKSEGIPLSEALDRVKSGTAKKSSRRKKGD